MNTTIVREIFRRDLNRLKEEISAYREEAAIWQVKNGIANPAGNLCLHLVGNLNTYIGQQLGGTNYVRNRDLEFSRKNVPREELLRMIEDTAAVVEATLSSLPDSHLEEEFPVLVFDKKTTTGYMLVHLAAHLSYHLGQVNYHRRLLDKAYRSD